MASSAWSKIKTAYRPSTRSAHRTHLRTYLSFVVFMDLQLHFTIHSVLAFLEFLYVNNISYKVILNYLASLRSNYLARRYNWDTSVLAHQLGLSYLISISQNSCFNPPSRGIFSLQILSDISKACNILFDPPLFRGAFLLAFFALLGMSNIALHSEGQFNLLRRILRQDILFFIDWSPCPS